MFFLQQVTNRDFRTSSTRLLFHFGFMSEFWSGTRALIIFCLHASEGKRFWRTCGVVTEYEFVFIISFIRFSSGPMVQHLSTAAGNKLSQEKLPSCTSSAISRLLPLLQIQNMCLYVNVFYSTGTTPEPVPLCIPTNLTVSDQCKGTRALNVKTVLQRFFKLHWCRKTVV